MLYKRSSISGLTNLWYERPGKRHSLLYQALIFLLPNQRPYIVKNMCIYTHICVQTVYELPLLHNNTAVKLFTQIGAVRIVDWIFIVGAPAWRSLGQCVTSGWMFYSLLMKQEAVSNPVASKSVEHEPSKTFASPIYCYSHYKCM